MERNELAKRYQQAQFKAMATAAEQRPAEDPEQSVQQEQASTEPEAPTFAQRLAQAARIKPKGIDNYMSPDDRLRRWAGLK